MDNSFFVYIFRFYSKCLSFPYSELGLELQYLFRQMEVSFQNEMDEQLAAHALDILNNFQGEEMSALQAEYSRLFSFVEGEEPRVSVFFTEYGSPGSSDKMLDELYASDLDVAYNEAPESVINLLDYFSYLSESEDVIEKVPVFIDIMLPFSNALYAASHINFYKEVSKGLKELCELLNE